MVGVLEFLIIALSPAHEVQLDSPRLTISFRADQAIFPSVWQTDEIKPEVSPVAVNEEGACIATLKSALAKYPRSVPERNLKTVYISSKLKFYGLDYGGTNSNETVYLTLVEWKEQNFNLRFLERAFHHEFSSILLRNYAREFPTKEWNAALPAGFAYRGDGTQSLREGTANTQYEATFNDRGFLAEYSTSSLEEDFNLYAEAILSGDRAFWSLYDRYPKVARKADLVIDFYRRIDPAFSRSNLRLLAQAQAG